MTPNPRATKAGESERKAGVSPAAAPREPRGARWRFWAKLAGLGALGVALIGLALAWSLVPDLRRVVLDDGVALLERFSTAPWAPFAMVPLFVVAGLVSFPVTVLIPTAGMLFGPVVGSLVSLAGIVASATVLYWVGRWLGEDVVYRVGGRMFRAASSRLADKSIVAVALVRNILFIPFTAANLVGGACGLPYGRYLVGTLIGMTPGTIVLCVLGHRVGRAVVEPGPLEVGMLIGSVVVAIGTAWGLQRWAEVRRGRQT